VAKELLNEGQATVDLVAAIPSLHGGVTLLLVLFLWPRVRRRWRPLLAIYPVLMAFSLVYTGEHYVVDVLVGWVLAVGVTVAAGRIERRIMRARDPDTLADDSPGADLEATCPPTATTPSSI
jgi:membrane-associated phospholipid phosphatase